ncbi:terminase [Streptomyces sp. B8F3]|uniref:terminase n=1 Tax=Streptomyces sp. B8F3 TaxID=3153573 RepID=UPI00325E49D8
MHVLLAGQQVPLAADGLPEGTPDAHGIPTLGWGVLAWAETFLGQPDGPTAGEPWTWTPTQARIVAWWYALDHAGAWLFRRGQLVLPKGAGKSPLAAALACCELGAEVVFDGFDAHGEAVGRPHPSPHVQIAAVSEQQTQNTYDLVLGMLREGEAAAVIEGLDIGLTRVRTRVGRLEPVTASATSREGQRLTAAVLDEPHLWTDANGGRKLAATVRRNLAKTDGRSLETTNTWLPGEESVAEKTADDAEQALARGELAGLLRYHPQATVKDLADEAEVRTALGKLYADAPWVNIDRVVEEIYDTSTEPADARRFYLNEVSVAEDALTSPHGWDACRADDQLAEGDAVVLGFDGSLRDDATALIACRVSDRLLVPLGIWERPEGPDGKGWEIDREAVDETVRAAFETYDVQGFFADVEHWESYVDAWGRDFREHLLVKATASNPVAWDMRGRLNQSTLANERLMRAVADTAVKHTGDVTLRRHVLNARRRPNRYGISFGKDRRGSRRKVDGWAAMLLAEMARYELTMSGREREDRDRRVIVLR